MHHSDEPTGIQQRMERLRAQSRTHASDVVRQSQRMLDWKEHLRSAPVTTFVVGALAGFTLLYRRSGSAVATRVLPIHSSSVPASPPPVASSSHSVRSLALSMATSFLLTTGKRALLRGLQTYLAQSHHGHQSNQRDSQRGSNPERYPSSLRTPDN
ncbi:hypothetical protein VN12_13860 [Pirellula sp. SH-Sr6A]|uniref:hypothetical protein n=1 Tax=Pirellula sp. SH-Sr6A TaxID=1632865 RepID=UPI00078C8F3E|nr:hypothetical protein [Pirellula sp. SH-Sr6A]AMV33207.1 hypothetical protein VN12_13860 [Pirellula sp. SH-Sr6A]